MRITFDPKKSERNRLERGLPFSMAEEFNFFTATRRLDLRQDYGEERWITTGFIGKRLHVLCYTWEGKYMRVISLRKANARERRKYEQEIEAIKTMDE